MAVFHPIAGSVTPASLGGYSSGTGHGKVVQVKADGSGFDFVAPVTAPTADTLTGATDTGKRVLKATDAAAARTAIGAGTSSFSGSYDDLTEQAAIPAPTRCPRDRCGVGWRQAGCGRTGPRRRREYDDRERQDQRAARPTACGRCDRGLREVRSWPMTLIRHERARSPVRQRR